MLAEVLKHALNNFSFSFPALLVVETETFGSHIRIKGKESEHYICMNEKGKIVGRVSVSWFSRWERSKKNPTDPLVKDEIISPLPNIQMLNGTLNPG